MTEDSIPVALKWTVRDYEFPPECCRCNSKLGDASLEAGTTLGRKGRFYLNKGFKVPICSECLEGINRAIRERERRFVRPSVWVLIASVATIIILFSMGALLNPDKYPIVGAITGLLVLVSLIGIIGSLGLIISAKSGSKLRVIGETVAFGPNGFEFYNKDYQARVKPVISTYSPRGYDS